MHRKHHIGVPRIDHQQHGAAPQPGHKSLFVSFSSEKESAFFSEEKKQKTFAPSLMPAPRCR
jgi:hypothetical protein